MSISNTDQIAVTDFLNALKRRVQEFGPDYVYEPGSVIVKGDYRSRAITNEVNCKYEKGGSPSCIIGQVLFHDKGFSVETLHLLDESKIPADLIPENAFDDYFSEDEYKALIDSDGNYDIGDASAASILEFLEYPTAVADIAQVAQSAQDNGYSWGEAYKLAVLRAINLDYSYSVWDAR